MNPHIAHVQFVHEFVIRNAFFPRSGRTLLFLYRNQDPRESVAGCRRGGKAVVAQPKKSGARAAGRVAPRELRGTHRAHCVSFV